jgi:hypothetical protein
MAAVASRSQVIEIEPQVRPHFDWDLVIGVQVRFVPREASSQFIQHYFCRRCLNSDFSTFANDVRLPTAIHTAPVVSLETQNAQAAMTGVIPAFRAGTATIVLFTLPPAPVQLARPARPEFAAAWSRARPKYSRLLYRHLTHHAHLPMPIFRK